MSSLSTRIITWCQDKTSDRWYNVFVLIFSCIRTPGRCTQRHSLDLRSSIATPHIYKMAELAGLPVPRMDWHSSDAPQALKKFKAFAELYFKGPLIDKSEEEKISYLLIWSGEEGIELASTWSLSADEKKKLDTYWSKFENYVSPKSNFRLARYKLRTLQQQQDETVDSFLKKVRVLVNECKFANADEHIIDALIFGSKSAHVQSKLLKQDATLTLDKAIDIARTQEATNQQLQDIRGNTSSTAIHALQKGKPSNPAKQVQSKLCGNCGTQHDLSKKALCPAYGSECRACGKPNHWKKVCRSAKVKNPPRRKQSHGPNKDRSKPGSSLPVHTVTEEGNTPDIPQLYFDPLTVDGLGANDKQAVVKVQVSIGQRSVPLVCKVDTGAEGNVIPVSLFKELCPDSPCDSSGPPIGLTPSTTTITAFGGNNVQHYGTCTLNLEHDGRSKSYPFHVVNAGGPTILGLPTCTDMNLVTLHCSISTRKQSPLSPGSTSKRAGNPEAKAKLLSQYPDCFEGIGCFKGEFHITLDPNVSPVVHPPRRVPEALREPLKKELDSLVDQGIIAKVDEPTDWVNSLVCVRKSNGSLRLCLDPKDLNRAIKRPYHCTPTHPYHCTPKCFQS